jgi:hypothetical protein
MLTMRAIIRLASSSALSSAMPAPTPAYRLKIERAKRHIRELAEEIQTFIARNPYSTFAEDDTGAGQRVWKVKINEGVPEGWSTIVGDAIHNARAALDLLMVAVVRHCDPNRQSYNHVHFIIRESKDEFESSLPKNIKGASSEARRIIENLKPYKGGDEAFWRLHQLDILDKHKAIIPVGSAYRSVGIAINFERMFPNDPKVAGFKTRPVFVKPADRLFPLKDGAELFKAPLNQVLPFDDDLQFRFEIAFGEGQIVDGQPLIPALTQICEFVEGVFAIVEKHISVSNPPLRGSVPACPG